jgi:uncharacterized membrane protein YedE/YeeE
MKNILFLFIGIVFGLALTKGEAVSWFRIQEMFHFQSFHMYGIFMTAVPVGALSLLIIKRIKLRTIDKEEIEVAPRHYHHGLIIGGLIFGFGWALTGACPGPLYALLGAGYEITIVIFLSALCGTWFFGLVRNKLPH